MSKISDGRIAVFGLLAVAVWLYVVLPLGYLSWLSMAEKPTETIAGIGSLGWTAIGATANVAYDLLTVGILWFAGTQIVSARREARINRTLDACNRYDTDPVLDRVTRRLSYALENQKIQPAPDKYRMDIFSIFNYLESIAIGVNRGLYDEAIVRDHMEFIIRDNVEDFVDSGIAQQAGIDIGEKDEELFNTLMALQRRWKPSS